MDSDQAESELYNGRITFLIRDDGATLELRDELSRQKIVKIELSPDQLLRILSRQAEVGCNIKTCGLDRVGKKMLMENLTFEMPLHTFSTRKEIAYQEAIRVCPDGWYPDLYFGYKYSFFKKDGKEYARTTIRKWILPDVSESE